MDHKSLTQRRFTLAICICLKKQLCTRRLYGTSAVTWPPVRSWHETRKAAQAPYPVLWLIEEKCNQPSPPDLEQICPAG